MSGTKINSGRDGLKEKRSSGRKTQQKRRKSGIRTSGKITSPVQLNSYHDRKEYSENVSSSDNSDDAPALDNFDTRRLTRMFGSVSTPNEKTTKVSLNPNARTATVRRITSIPFLDKDQYPHEWQDYPYKTFIDITDQPSDYIRPGESVSFRFGVTDPDGNPEMIKSAKIHRYIGNNGILLYIQLRKMNVYVIVNLVSGDEELNIVKLSNQNVHHKVIDIPSNLSNSHYYVPGSVNIIENPDLILHENQITMLVSIMQPSIKFEGQYQPYRILLRTITRLSYSTFIISSRIIVQNKIITNEVYMKKALCKMLTDLKSDNAFTTKVEDFASTNSENTLIGIINMIDDYNLSHARSLDRKTFLHYSSWFGFDRLTEFLLVKSDSDQINALDCNNRTPLFYAVEQGHKSIAKILIESFADVSIIDIRGDNVTDFSLWSDNAHILDGLINKEDDDSESDEIFIHDLYQHGDVDAVKDLISKNRKLLFKTDALGRTPLHIASHIGNLELISIAVINKVKISAQDNQLTTPLHQAVFSGSPACVAYLCNSNARVDARDIELVTPLFLSILRNQNELAITLMNFGANVNLQNNQGISPMHLCCQMGNVEILEYLIELGGNPDAVTADGHTVCDIAAIHGQNTSLELLLARGANIHTENSTPLHNAAKFGFSPTVELLLNNECDPNDVDSDGNTPLHHASFFGHHDVVLVLLENDVEIDTVNNKGESALHFACLSGNEDCVNILLKAGASTSLVDVCGQTALHKASFGGSVTIINNLLKYHVDSTVTDSAGRTALHLACVSGSTECVHRLFPISKVNQPDSKGMTPLMLGVCEIECTEILLENGADVHEIDGNGESALYHAIKSRYHESAKAIIFAGGDIFQRDKYGIAPIDIVQPQFKDFILDSVKASKLEDIDIEQAKIACELFNNEKTSKFLTFIIESGIVEDISPQQVAIFLLKMEGVVDKKIFGQFIGGYKEFNVGLLDAFTKQLNFTGMSIDNGIRYYLSFFTLPGEAQQIERIMEAFINRYYEINSDVFPDLDTAFTIAYSIIMLNTDLHNEQVKKKMTKAEYIHNARGCWGPENLDPPRDLMEELYDSIEEDEIPFLEKDISQEASKRGNLKKYGTSRNNKPKKLYFTVQDNCMYYFKSAKVANKPYGIIPLENITVNELPKAKFSLESDDGATLKSCKMQNGQMMQSKETKIILGAESDNIRDAWIKVLRANSSVNPFYNLLKKRVEVKHEQENTTVQPTLWKYYYNLLLLIKNCSLSKTKIRKLYGKNTLVNKQNGIEYFVLDNPEQFEYKIIFFSEMWQNEFKEIMLVDEGTIKRNFDFMEYFQISERVTNIVEELSIILDKQYSLTIAGYSLGGVLATLVGYQLRRSHFYKVKDVVTFSTPSVVPESEFQYYDSLSIHRILDHRDPSQYLFPGYINRGSFIMLESGGTYTKKIVKKKTTSAKRLGRITREDIEYTQLNIYIKHMSAIVEGQNKQM